MPVSSLNKVISLFLVGALAILVAGYLFRDQVKLVPPDQTAGGPLGAVVLGFLLLSASGLAGALIDGIAELVVRNLIILRTRRRRAWAQFFVQARMHDSVQHWKKHFIRLVSNKPEYASLICGQEKSPYDPTSQLAATIFFSEANEEHFEWLISHYATYYMATSFVVLLLLSTIAGVANLPKLEVDYIAWVVLASTLSCYILTSLAVNRYLYAHMTTYRFACLKLLPSAPQIQP